MPLHKTRIDPSLPVVWESVETLRIGFDVALTRIENPSAAAQRFLHRLQRGILENTLSTVAHESGCTPAERDRIYYLCSPLLIRESHRHVVSDSPITSRQIVSHSQQGTVNNIAVIGSHRARQQVTSTLRCRGFQIHPARNLMEIREAESLPQLIVFLERFWAVTHTLHSLMLLDIPHLIVRFSDQTVSIGPVIYPGHTPCGVCMQLTDAGVDPALPILAAQLLRTVPAAELPHVVDFASVIACMLLCSVVSHQVSERSARYVYRVQQGKISLAPTIVEYSEQSTCGCQTLIEEDQHTPVGESRSER